MDGGYFHHACQPCRAPARKQVISPSRATGRSGHAGGANIAADHPDFETESGVFHQNPHNQAGDDPEEQARK